jgi:hypothetical protein
LEDSHLKNLKLLSGAVVLGALLLHTVSFATPAKRLALSGSTKAAALQGGKLFSHQASGVQFELPAGWKTEPDGEQITVSSADDSFTLVFWALDETTFEAAIEALDEELGKVVSKAKVSGEPKKDTHNGMPHVSLDGTGEVEGVAIHWSVDLLMAKKPVVVLTFVSSDDIEKHAGDYAKLVQSIKKIK